MLLPVLVLEFLRPNWNSAIVVMQLTDVADRTPWLKPE